jgi:hypothetical protein
MAGDGLIRTGRKPIHDPYGAPQQQTALARASVALLVVCVWGAHAGESTDPEASSTPVYDRVGIGALAMNFTEGGDLHYTPSFFDVQRNPSYRFVFDVEGDMYHLRDSNLYASASLKTMFLAPYVGYRIVDEPDVEVTLGVGGAISWSEIDARLGRYRDSGRSWSGGRFFLAQMTYVPPGQDYGLYLVGKDYDVKEDYGSDVTLSIGPTVVAAGVFRRFDRSQESEKREAWVYRILSTGISFAWWLLY